MSRPAGRKKTIRRAPNQTIDDGGKRRCSICYALIPSSVTECPKCGGTVFESDGGSSPLRKVHRFFTVAEFFTKAKPPIVLNGELVKVPIEWKLYKARVQQKAPPIFLWDQDGYIVPGKPEASLYLVEDEDLAHILTQLPERKIGAILKSIKEEWATKIDEEDSDPIDILKKAPIIYEPVPRLRDPSILEKLDWRNYVEKLVCPKPGKDPVLIAVHKAKLLKPLAMKYAPHSLEITNSGTGKSSFYNVAGILVDKATSRSVLGYARSPSEVYPGTINQTELSTAFDQLESQTSPELARYMFNILETGKALVDAGGFRFPVETKSSFAYLGNPIAKDAKVLEGFKALLLHLSVNPAIGRRFGIILFRTGLKAIRGPEKMSLTEEEEWRHTFTLFRAVEEYVLPKLRDLIRKPEITEWLHKPIKGYRTMIKEATRELKDYNMALFFEAHAEAEHRVRGAALHTAVALLLDKIALDKFTIKGVLEEAEDHLSDYVDINTQSIVNLAQMWQSLRVEQAKLFFDNQSNYMKEVISACLHYKHANPDEVKVNLASISYEAEDTETYKYFSRCINRLKKRKRLASLNERLKNYLGFQLEKEGENFTVLYFEHPKPPEDLPLIGRLIHLSDFSIYPKNEVKGSKTKREADTSKDPKSPKGVSKKADKRRKRINGEKPASKICGNCVFFHTPVCVEEDPDLILRTATYAEKCSKFRRKKD